MDRMPLYNTIYDEVRKHLRHEDADYVARRLSDMSAEDALRILRTLRPERAE